jgi:D-alanyl-D-alanine carboxypeptidase
MALLTRALLRDFPEHRGMFAEERMQVGAVRLRSHNTLLTSFEGADGMKTGFICAAGFNVVASATRGGRQLVAVVLGEVSGRARADRAAALLEHGFENYEWKLHFSAPAIETMAFAPVEAGEAQDLRTQLRSFECGGGARVAARKARRARALAKAKASRARKVAVAPDGSKATQGSDGQVVIQNPPSAAAAATVVTGAADRNKPHAAPKLPSANAASQDPSKAR